MLPASYPFDRNNFAGMRPAAKVDALHDAGNVTSVSASINRLKHWWRCVAIANSAALNEFRMC